MLVAGCYGQTDNLPKAMKALCLFFKEMHVILDEHVAERVIDDSPETIGYLVENGNLVFEDAESFFRAESVYSLQRNVLSWCLDNIDLDVDEYLYAYYKRTLRAGKAFEGFFANDFVDAALVERLVERRWALPVGASLPKRSYSYPDDEGGMIFAPDDSTHYVGERSEGSADVMTRRGDVPPEGSVPVLLHPTVWDLHESLALLAIPRAGRSYGQHWVPVKVGYAQKSRGHHSSESLDVVLDKIRHNAGLEGALGSFVANDFASLDLDLDSVPLEDIMEFREANAENLDEYFRDAIRLVAESSLSDGVGAEVRERSAALIEAAAAIRSATARRWGVRRATVAVSVAGFAWYLSHGQIADSLLTAIPGLLSAVSTDRPDTPSSAQLFANLAIRFGSYRFGSFSSR